MTQPDVSNWRQRVEERLKVTDLDMAVVIPLGETPEDRAERLERQARAKAARWLDNLPMSYRDATLEGLAEDQHGPTLRAWLAGSHPTLILAGEIGAGKTHAAYALGNEAIHHGLFVVGVNVHDLLEAARPDGDRSLVHAARAADVLVLDDLGATRVSEFAQDTLAHLIGRRVSEGKRQVITTNATPAEITEAWGARLMSRLSEGSMAATFTGPSRRVALW